jgi:hypothetical protein
MMGRLKTRSRAAVLRVRKVDLDFPANLALQSNGEDVPDNEHADREHRVERWPADR